MNLVEMIADKQHQSPCKFGNIVNGHACYCHHPDGLRKCSVWRKYAEDVDKWHNKGDWDREDWAGGCKFFVAL